MPMDRFPLPSSWAIAGLAISCVAIIVLVRRRYDRLPYPPGPKAYPLLGNLLDMPSEYEYVQFREWSKVYGPVVHLATPRGHLIVLNTLQSAVDLIEKRSLIYSDRPHMTMLMDVIGWDWSFVLFNYGKKLTRYRRIIQKGLNANKSHYQDIQQQETMKLLHNLRTSPAKFMMHIEHWSKSMIVRMTYGYEAAPSGDHYIWLSNRCVEAIAKAGKPGAYLVDTFPLLKWVPGWFPFTRFKKDAATWSPLVREVLESPMSFAKESIAAGTAEPSYVRNLLQMNSEKLLGESDEEQAIKETAAILHTAGADSVYSTIQSFILAMTLHPEVQAKAQGEIDAVVGTGRLPNFSDRPHLPYVDKVVLETLRWSWAAPMAIAHELRSDDIYNGMFVPAGSIVLTNIWAIKRDETLYKQADTFCPERFETAGVQDPRAFVFGFGKRICVGKSHGEPSVWISIVSILASFHISKSLDADGIELTPKVEYTSGSICHPKPFSCDIRPRTGRTIG